MIELIKKIIFKIKEKLELRKYDDFTIERYFVKKGLKVGKNNRIMVRSLGEGANLVRIGNHCTITAGVDFITHDGGVWIFTDEVPDLQKFGYIRIHDNCFIGLNSTIMPNVTIGPNSVVGACSVVTKDVPPDTVVAGNPARVICSVADYKRKSQELWNGMKPEGYLENLKPGITYSPKFIDTQKKKQIKYLYEHIERRFKEINKI